MAEVAETMEGQAAPSSDERAASARGARQGGALARKSYAKQIARMASKTIRDRHQRAAVKVHIYNQLLPVLETHAREQARLRSFNRKLLAMLGVCLLLLGGAATLLVG